MLKQDRRFWGKYEAPGYAKEGILNQGLRTKRLAVSKTRYSPYPAFAKKEEIKNIPHSNRQIYAA